MLSKIQKNTLFILFSVLLVMNLFFILNCRSHDSKNDIKKWKYKVVEITFKSNRGIEPFLNEYGKAGWELIQKSGNEYIFRR